MRRGKIVFGAVALWAVLGTMMPASAEVSVDIDGPNSFQIIILGITEGPDPFGMWEPIRDIEPVRVLNIEGTARGDGRPAVADPATGSLLVAWAYNAGTDFDIAVSEWTGFAWSDPQFLTSETTNDVDPNVFIDDDGTTYVVWWVQETQKVYMATRPADSLVWDEPIEVTPAGTTGQFPSVVVWHRLIHVSYERHSSTGSQNEKEVVVMRRKRMGGSFKQRVIARVARLRSLEVRLHAQSGILWADWLHSNDKLGFSQGRIMQWEPVRTTEWLDESWVGIEDGRARIRMMLVDPGTDDSVEPGNDNGEPVQGAAERFDLNVDLPTESTTR